MALIVMTLGADDGGREKRAENAWRWLCRVVGAVLLGLLVMEQGFKGPVGLYFLFAGLMTLGDVIAEAIRLRREIQEMRQKDDDR
jgi:hypothetical protein